MASVIFKTTRSQSHEKQMEKFRACLKEVSGDAIRARIMRLDEQGLYIGQVLQDPEVAVMPMLSILVQSWDSAGIELREFARDMLSAYQFNDLQVVGLD